jgi:hypothetical protein
VAGHGEMEVAVAVTAERCDLATGIRHAAEALFKYYLSSLEEYASHVQDGSPNIPRLLSVHKMRLGVGRGGIPHQVPGIDSGRMEPRSKHITRLIR